MRQHSLDVIVYDAADVEEFNTAQKRLEPNFSNGFTDLDGDEAGKVSPSHKKVSICARKLVEEIGG